MQPLRRQVPPPLPCKGEWAIINVTDLRRALPPLHAQRNLLNSSSWVDWFRISDRKFVNHTTEMILWSMILYEQITYNGMFSLQLVFPHDLRWRSIGQNCPKRQIMFLKTHKGINVSVLMKNFLVFLSDCLNDQAILLEYNTLKGVYQSRDFSLDCLSYGLMTDLSTMQKLTISL